MFAAVLCSAYIALTVCSGSFIGSKLLWGWACLFQRARCQAQRCKGVARKQWTCHCPGTWCSSRWKWMLWRSFALGIWSWAIQAHWSAYEPPNQNFWDWQTFAFGFDFCSWFQTNWRRPVQVPSERLRSGKKLLEVSQHHLPGSGPDGWEWGADSEGWAANSLALDSLWPGHQWEDGAWWQHVPCQFTVCLLYFVQFCLFQHWTFQFWWLDSELKQYKHSLEGNGEEQIGVQSKHIPVSFRSEIVSAGKPTKQLMGLQWQIYKATSDIRFMIARSRCCANTVRALFQGMMCENLG